MKKKLVKILGLKTLIVIALERVFHKILISLDYYTVHLPIKNEVLELHKNNFKASSANNLVCVSIGKEKQKYLLRPQSSDKMVFYQVIVNQEYFPVIDLIQCYNLQNTIITIIDAGANIGLTSLFFKQHFPKAQILAIEPDLDNHIHLLKNIKLNKLSKSINTIHKALWKNNTAKLNISSDFRDGQSWAKSVIENINSLNTIDTITLSDLIAQNFPDGTIDILKMDIEGSEKVLFKNTEFIETLSAKVRFLCLEIHDELNCRGFITQTLNDCNFSVEDIGETTFCVNKSIVNLLVNA